MKTILALLLAVALLSACGDSDRDSSSATTNPAGDDAQFTFVSPVDIHTLDPGRISWLQDVRLALCLYDPLVRYNLEDLSLEPSAAATWQASPDHKTYTFHLRPGATWSNGEPVTARDFIYAWRRVILPDIGGDYTQLFFCIRGAREFFDWRRAQLSQYQAGATRSPEAAQALWEEAQKHFARTVGLSAPDDLTLVVELAQPTPHFLELCAFVTFMPVHEKSVAQRTRALPDTGYLQMEPGYWSDPQTLVSCGPYVLERYRPKRDMLLKARDTYWNRAAMGNRAILQRVIDDPQTAMLSYSRGEVDWVPDMPTAKSFAADLVVQNRKDVHVYQAAGTYFYNFNCDARLADGRANPLADARVRRALALAIDRQAIVEQVTRMRQPIARSFVPPQVIPGYEPPVEAGAVLDLGRAKALLAEAGYPNGKGLTGLSILYNPEGGHENIAQAIKHAWQVNLGVIVTLDSVESRTFGDKLKKHDYTICRASWFGDYRDPTTFLDKFITGNGNNDAGYRNPKFDGLMTQATQEPDAKARLALLREAEALVLADSPIAPIYHYREIDVHDASKVTGLRPNAWKFTRLERVRVTR